MIALKTLLFTVVVPGSVTILVPYLILTSGDGTPAPGATPLRWLGLPPLALGVAIYAWCAFDFVSFGRGTPAPIDPPKRLVVRGLYRFTRNPMYVGVLSILCGEALWFGSPALLLYALAVFGMFQTFVVVYEEPTLRRLFGADYERYRAGVPRWVGRRRATRRDPGRAVP